MNQVGSNAEVQPQIDLLGRALRDDLEAANPWIVPIKGGVALAAG
jgi:hypothetical protein